jgi:hypothetical protein
MKNNKIKNKLKNKTENNNLKLKTMKKQILILIVAIFAAAVTAFGQSAVHNTPAQPLTCNSADALHPIAGTPYNYSVTTTPIGGQYQWWATKQTQFITGGAVNTTGMLTVSAGQLLATSPDYNAPATAGSSVTVTWSSELLAGTATATPTFVAVNYANAPGGCANNLKVYQIIPVNGFTVDIYNMSGNTLSSTLAWGATYSTCISDVASANWDGSQMVYDYGVNTLTYEVVAANFSTSWTPSFQVGALGNGQTADLQWDYTPAFTSPVTVQSGIPQAGGTYTSSTTANTTETDTHNGVSIFVRLIIHNNTYEGINATPVTLAVNGMNSVNQPDVVNTDCATNTLFEDIATQTLNPRPGVTQMPVAPGFVPANTTN